MTDLLVPAGIRPWLPGLPQEEQNVLNELDKYGAVPPPDEGVQVSDEDAMELDRLLGIAP